MIYEIATGDLSKLSERIAADMGLHFPAERWPDLERGILAAAGDFGFSDLQSCVQWLMASRLQKHHIEILAAHLTIGETYFFRDPAIFSALRERMLPELIRARRTGHRHLRIWSAGCATGEEPYSIAILLETLIADIDDWNVTILATDINPDVLRRAEAGVYGEWAFRNMDRSMRDRYFTKARERQYLLHPRIKKMVAFRYLNLVEDRYPSLDSESNAMDIIFCRNVCMYFDAVRQRQVIEKLHHALMDDGWLIVSPCEASHTLFSRFQAVMSRHAILYRKVGDNEFTGHPEKTVNQAYAWSLPSMAPPAALMAGAVAECQSGTGVPEPPVEPADIPVMATESPAPIPRPSYEQALQCYIRGAYADAVAVLKRLDHTDAAIITLLIRACANMGRLTEALEWSEKAVHAHKLNPCLNYLWAMLLLELGRLEEAAVALRRTLYLDSTFVLAHFALGQLLQRQGKAAQSVLSLRNALSILETCNQTDIVPESEGVPAGRLRAIILYAMNRESVQ